MSGTSMNMAYMLRASCILHQSMCIGMFCMYLTFGMMRASCFLPRMPVSVRRVHVLAFLFHALACALSLPRIVVRRALALHLRHRSRPRIAPGVRQHDGVGIGGAVQVGVLVQVRRASRRHKTRRRAALLSPAFVGRYPVRRRRACSCACGARVRFFPRVVALGRVVAAVRYDMAGVAAL